LAFPPTAKFFDAWAGKVLNYLLLVVILAFAVGFSISMCDTFLQSGIESLKSESSNSLADAFAIVMLNGALLFVVFQAPQLASGLAGGASLSGGGLLDLAQSAAISRVARSAKGAGTSSPGNASIGPSALSSTAGSGSTEKAESAPNGTRSRVPAYRQATLNNLSGSKRR
jgi:type IV secretion system protein VirB6